MKIAGRKNDGAWYRTNRWLRNPQISAQIKATIAADVGLLAAYAVLIQVLNDIATHSGAGGVVSQLPGAVSTPEALLTKHIDTGFPRQVWMGHLSWDVYQRVAPGGQFPNQVSIFWDTENIPTIDIADGMTARHNTKPVVVYAPRNRERMDAVGEIVRRRMGHLRLAMRHAADLFNAELASAGNPGGVADSAKDPVPGL